MNHPPEYSLTESEYYLLHGGIPPNIREPQKPEMINGEGLTEEDWRFLCGKGEQYPLRRSLFRRLLTKITAVFQLGC